MKNDNIKLERIKNPSAQKLPDFKSGRAQK
jgi:hypothetical protein